jgi:hypothetical protein
VVFPNRGIVRIGVLALVLAAEFALLEAGMRAVGGSEAAPSFQQIFIQDSRMGHRLKPGARTVYSTVEFTTEISINAQGVRDDRDFGPKRPGQTRVTIGSIRPVSARLPLASSRNTRYQTPRAPPPSPDTAQTQG